jgi:hypothetical protein
MVTYKSFLFELFYAAKVVIIVASQSLQHFYHCIVVHPLCNLFVQFCMHLVNLFFIHCAIVASKVL